jgi:hypothetical protein
MFINQVLKNQFQKSTIFDEGVSLCKNITCALEEFARIQPKMCNYAADTSWYISLLY